MQEDPKQETNASKKLNPWQIKTGVILMVVSIPVFLLAFIIPFLDFDAKIKVTVTTVLLISAEILFWGGGLLAGKELFTKYKQQLDPRSWFKKKKSTTAEEKNQL